MITVFKMKKFRKTLLRATGASLAEFAVVSALMATLAATAMPKLSALTERAKAEKTMKEIDKMLNMAQTYFNISGQYADGSSTQFFPGQEKHTMPVGDYGREVMPGEDSYDFYRDSVNIWKQEVLDDLQEFDRYNHPLGSKWRSVFGLVDEVMAPEGNHVQDEWWEDCWDCSLENQPGHYGVPGWFHWRWLFNHNHLYSPYQDGHYIYVIIPGGNGKWFPTLVIADLENPKDFNKWLTP